MPKIIYYSLTPFTYAKQELLDQLSNSADLLKLTKFFSTNAGIIDRTGTIKLPFNAVSSYPIPVLEDSFNLTYTECVMDRMTQLDAIHQSSGKKFRLLYSGGVDSTGILAAFINYYGLDKASKILEISCTKESIAENPWTWDRYVRAGKFRILSSQGYNAQWNDDVIRVMGEGNDQLYGLTAYMVYKRNTNLYAPLTIEAVIDFLEKGKPSPDSKHVAELLLEVCKAAPIEINNMYLFAWWFNYAIFWDCVCSRVYAQTTLDVAQPSKLIQFYNTDKFQKWGIHFHKQFPDQYGEFENYKKASKDMITSILAIPEYKDKFKFNSFPVIHSLKPNGLFVDDQLAVYRDLADIVKFV